MTTEQRPPNSDAPPDAAATDWFRRAFDSPYRLVYSARDDRAAAAEIAHLVRELELRPSDRVLDLCCGDGRHLRALARRSIPAVGFDLSRDLLAAARKGDATSPRVVRGDMRALPFRRAFDVVLNLFTSFGYFVDDGDHVRAASALAGALRPGGRFAIDLMNAARVVATLAPETERKINGVLIRETRSFSPATRRVEKRVTIEPPDARPQTYTESVRLFAPDEIASILRRASLEVTRLLGDFAGEPFVPTSPRMIVLGRYDRDNDRR